MKKRQIATAWITCMLIAAVFFLSAVVSSDKSVHFPIIVPIFLSLPFLAVGIFLIYFFRDTE